MPDAEGGVRYEVDPPDFLEYARCDAACGGVCGVFPQVSRPNKAGPETGQASNAPSALTPHPHGHLETTARNQISCQFHLCDDWHWHGPLEGHRIAHCHDPASLYEARGYNIQLVERAVVAPARVT